MPRPRASAGLRRMEKAGGRSMLSQGGEEIGEASRDRNPAGAGGREQRSWVLLQVGLEKVSGTVKPMFQRRLHDFYAENSL